MTEGRSFMLTAVLAVGLLGLWLVLSGHYEPLMIGFGVGASLLITWVARRMRIVDPEGVPLHQFPGVLLYTAWLVKEIFVANVQMARIVLSPRLPISPTLIYFRAGQRTDLGRVIYANSITLTPGTITTGVDGDDFRIHTVAWSFVDGHEEHEMDYRVTALEGDED